MAKKRQLADPPYFRLGEAGQLLAAAFGTKRKDGSARRKLDRLAREGDFDWQLLPQLARGLLIEPLAQFDPDYAKLLESYLSDAYDRYVSVVKEIALDSLPRDEAASLLMKSFYAGHIAEFVGAIRDKWGGPDLAEFMRGDNPIEVVFRWAEETLKLHVVPTVYPDVSDKIQRDKAARWRRGTTVPEDLSAIELLQKGLISRLPKRRTDIALFGKWLITGRALAWLDKASIKAGYGSLIDLLRKDLLLAGHNRDFGMILSTANAEAGQGLSELMHCGLSLSRYLTNGEKKDNAGKEKARETLTHFKDLLNKYAPDGRATYMLDWCEGLWHILSGEPMKALPFYEAAADGALYRAGKNQHMILDEALILTAYLKKRTAFKRFRHRSFAMTSLHGKITDPAWEPEGALEREMEAFANKFAKRFPPEEGFQ